MSLKLTEREREGIKILDLDGRLVVGNEVASLRQKLNEELDGGNKRIVLNLKELDYIDSTGLGTLVICFTRLQKAGGTLKLLNLNRRNVELLILTKLTTVFEIFNDEQDAVNSFFAGRKVQRFDILDFVQGKDRG